MKIILASKSPRRLELLGRMGIDRFDVLPALGEELAPPGMDPAELVELLSARKAEEVAARAEGVAARAEGEALIIAADTVVSVDGLVLGKPADEAQAAAMLRRLSSREHRVYTGVTVRRGALRATEHQRTDVRFRPLTDDEISAYVATGEPMDKAGAYGIQGLGSMLVEGISGDFYNVMGLPVCRLGRMLARFGIDCLTGEGLE